MFKKFIYSLVIMMTIVGLFGVRGVGVQNAAAFIGYWSDTRALAVDTPLPYYSTINLNAAGGADPGNLGGCAVAPSFGAYQTHLLDSNTYTAVTYLHVRIIATNSADYVQNSWAVRVSQDDAGLTELGCALNNASGVIDFIVVIPANTGVLVTLASNGIYVPSANPFKAWVTRGTYPSGGLIVDMQADGGNIANRTLEATNVADAGNGKYYTGVDFELSPFVNAAFLDIPAGTYNLGIQDQTMNAEFAAYYPGIVVLPNFITLTPENDAVVPLDVQITDWAGVAQNVATIALTPSSFGLNADLEVGRTGIGAEATGEKTFFVNPGYLWDVAAVDDSNLYGSGYNIFLIERAFNPTLGSLLFNIEAKPAAWVALCTNAGYTSAEVTIDPPGQLEMRTFNFKDGYVECAPYTGGLFGLTAGQDYDVSHSVVLGVGGGYCKQGDRSDVCMPNIIPNPALLFGWQYTYIPSIPIWNFAGNNDDWAYFQYFGDVPFKTTPDDGTSQPNYNLPLVGGEVALMRGPWTDQAGNTLKKILAPDNAALDCRGNATADTGIAPDVIQPCYTIETPSTAPVVLANDWLTTNLGPITHIGRYRYTRSLQHGLLPMAPAGVDKYNSLFTINPSDDVTLAGHWSWPWVEAMYEIGLTAGIGGGAYGPDLPVTRAEMATFLSRVLDMYGLPTGPAAAFSDVPASYWAHDDIAMLRFYSITDGCGSNMFCPEAYVTRAEMAKFIESTFRTIHAYGGSVYWDTSFHVLVPGLTFADVPVTYWANTWIEELFWDNLTSGCMRDGLTLYYCPDANVTRGEMAKFIVTAIQPDSVTEGFWPILSPSK